MSFLDNVLTAIASSLKTLTGSVDVSQSAAPVQGQVLTAIDDTHSVWRVPGLHYDPAIKSWTTTSTSATIEPGTWGFVQGGPPGNTDPITIYVVSSLVVPPVDSRFGLYVAKNITAPVRVSLIGASQIMGLDGALGPTADLLPGAMYEWIFYHEDGAALWGLVSDTAGIAKQIGSDPESALTRTLREFWDTYRYARTDQVLSDTIGYGTPTQIVNRWFGGKLGSELARDDADGLRPPVGWSADFRNEQALTFGVDSEVTGVLRAGAGFPTLLEAAEGATIILVAKFANVESTASQPCVRLIGGGDTLVELGCDGASHLYCNRYDAGLALVGAATAPIDADALHVIAARHLSGTSQDIWVDGVAGTAATGCAVPVAIDDLIVGGAGDSGGSHWDTVAVYICAGVLTDDELAAFRTAALARWTVPA